MGTQPQRMGVLINSLHSSEVVLEACLGIGLPASVGFKCHEDAPAESPRLHALLASVAFFDS